MPQDDLSIFLITWRTYGSWLPGDERGWIDEHRNGRGEPTHPADHRLERAAKGLMKRAPVTLDDSQRRGVDEAVRVACDEKGWHLHAVNVRTNHVHVVVSSDVSADRTQVALKAAGTKVLREQGLAPADGVVWSRGGSQRTLANEVALSAAVDYVRNRQ